MQSLRPRLADRRRAPIELPPPSAPEPEPEHVADVRAALVACGFCKHTANASVDRALTHVGRDAPTEELLRAAFRATKHVAG